MALVVGQGRQERLTAGLRLADDDVLQVTELGQDEIAKFVAAMRAWLAEELADWGPDATQLADALGDLATRFIEQTPELTPGPVAALGSGRSN